MSLYSHDGTGGEELGELCEACLAQLQGWLRRRAPGRPAGVPPELADWIIKAYEILGSYNAVAVRLNEEETPTVGGGTRWWPSTVKRVVLRGSPPARTASTTSHAGAGAPSTSD